MSTLRRGDEGPLVTKLQEKLGVDPIGKFGPKTEAALIAWQLSNGLQADGIAGPFTLAKLGIEDLPKSAPIEIPESGFKLHKLKGHIPDGVIAQIPDTAARFGITNTLRLAHFLSQCGHESGGFKAVRENLNYSAKGLVGIFKKYFSTTLAVAYERQPDKIANRVYAGRMGNGDENSGDGYKYRGRGYIQLTGKENYTAFGKSIGVDVCANPELVASQYALASAAWFFSKNGLHKMADEGASDAVVTKITKRVNGGTIGLPDRIKHFKEYYSLLA
jgi:putative chitinase